MTSSEERHRLISELTSDYAYEFRILADKSLVREWTSGAFTEITGYAAGELDVAGWETLYHPQDRELRINRIEQLLSGNPATTEFRILTKSGETRWLRDHARPILDSEGQVTHIVGAGQDITERKDAERLLEIRVRQQEAVALLGQRALAGADLNQLRDESCALAAKGLNADFCKILELVPGSDTLLLRAGTGWTEGLIGNLTFGSEEDTQSAYTLRSRAPVIVEDLSQETRFFFPPLLHEHGVVSGLSVIIGSQDHPFGVLAAHTKEKRTFTKDDINFLQSIANILAAAVDHDLRVHAEITVREMEENARHRTVILETANRVALDILSSRFGTEALRHIADSARILAGARYAALGVAAQDGKTLSEFITVGLTPQEEISIGPRPRGAGVLGLLLTRKEPLRIDTLAKHPASVGFPPNHPPMDSFLGVPIWRGETIAGSLYLTNKQGGGPFTEADEVAVQALGAHAAIAIHSIQMLSSQQALVARLMSAQEEERRAVAFDLHDGLTQYVMAAHAHLTAFSEIYATDCDAEGIRELQKASKYLKDAVTESRRLVNGLRLLSLGDLGLAGALQQLIDEEKPRAGWDDAQLVHNIPDIRFDKNVETGIYRVAQEALTNVRKHAATSHVKVTLLMTGEGKERRLELEVRDWGKGFPADSDIDTSRHVGLHSIAERVSLLNGKHKIDSALADGTTVHASFPVIENEVGE